MIPCTHFCKGATPPRRLREYKANDWYTYRVENGVVHVRDGDKWVPVDVVQVAHLAGVADLLANPKEPVETLEEVVYRILLQYMDADDVAKAWRELRAHLSQQTPSESSFGDCRCGITFTGHVNALLGMGAKYATVISRAYIAEHELSSGDRVLILPPEVSP